MTNASWNLKDYLWFTQSILNTIYKVLSKIWPIINGSIDSEIRISPLGFYFHSARSPEENSNSLFVFVGGFPSRSQETLRPPFPPFGVTMTCCAVQWREKAFGGDVDRGAHLLRLNPSSLYLYFCVCVFVFERGRGDVERSACSLRLNPNSLSCSSFDCPRQLNHSAAQRRGGKGETNGKKAGFHLWMGVRGQICWVNIICHLALLSFPCKVRKWRLIKVRRRKFSSGVRNAWSTTLSSSFTSSSFSTSSSWGKSRDFPLPASSPGLHTIQMHKLPETLESDLRITEISSEEITASNKWLTSGLL